MGDHRVNIKIEFVAHGKTYMTDMSINYWPDESTGVDERVAEFFRTSWDDALGVYYGLVAEAEARAREREERAELERLKAKYG